jgi:hypothetical protein
MAYHELAHNGLVKVLGPDVCSQGDEIATVDAFLLHTPLAFILSSQTLLVTLADFSLLLGLPTGLLGACLISSTAGTQVEEGQVLSAATATTHIVHGVFGRAIVGGSVVGGAGAHSGASGSRLPGGAAGIPHGGAMIVSQARCGEALERRRIPRSRSDYLLASRLHATNRKVGVVRDEAGTWGGKQMELAAFQ